MTNRNSVIRNIHFRQHYERTFIQAQFVAPRFVNVVTRWRGVTTSKLRLPYLSHRAPIPIPYEAGWAPYSLLRFRRRRRSRRRRSSSSSSSRRRRSSRRRSSRRRRSMDVPEKKKKK